MGDYSNQSSADKRPLGQGSAWSIGFIAMLGNYQLELPPGVSTSHERVIGLLGGGENSEASRALYNGCENVEVTKARFDFIGLASKTDLEQKKGPSDADPISLEDLLGPDGVIAYQKACEEENKSKAFREAVFLSSTKTYRGEKLDKRVILWVGGPSASGKSFATDDVIEKIMQEKSNEIEQNEAENKRVAENETDENHFVSIDGGVERQVSQMRQLVLQLALAKGYSGIEDLTKYDKKLKAKKHVREAAIASKKLNIVIPATFTDPFSDLKETAKRLNVPDNEQIYAQIREAPTAEGSEIFRDTVKVMGVQRAFGAVEMGPEDIKPNNRDIKVESKKYEPEHFQKGVEASDGRREYFKDEIKNSNYSYYEITFDLIFVKKGSAGRLVQVPNQLPLSEGTLKTNSRVFEAFNKYVDVAPDLEPGDFTKKVWVKKTGEWKNSIQKTQPNSAVDKDEYMIVSVAAVKVAKALNLSDQNFKTEWEKGVVKGEEFNIKNFKSSIHKGGNPIRERKKSDAAPVPYIPPTLLKQEHSLNLNSPGPASGFLTRTLQSPSAPVLEVAEPNQTLETIKLCADEAKLNIKILSENQAPDETVTSLKFQSNVPHEANHVKFEAELKKNNTVVYKMEPGNVGANFSSPAMIPTYELLVKVAFEAHFGNKATKDKQFIITVLPNLGKREQAFIDAIKAEAITRGLAPNQIKLLVPRLVGTKEMSIEGLTAKNQAMGRRPSA